MFSGRSLQYEKDTRYTFANFCLLLGACGNSTSNDTGPKPSPSAVMDSDEVASSKIEETPFDQARELTARVVVNGTVHRMTGYELDGDDLSYYSLLDISDNFDYDYTYNDVLSAFYIWTYPEVKQGITADDEIERAVSLGIGTKKATDTVITYTEFFQMLDRIVELDDPEKLPFWQEQLFEARSSNDPMTRYKGDAGCSGMCDCHGRRVSLLQRGLGPAQRSDW